MKLFSLAAILAANIALVAGAFAAEVDANLPAYKTVGALSGHIKSVGSDTLGDLMKRWADGFSALYPDVKIEIESKGSNTAPAALLDGSAQIGPMSRFMHAEESEALRKKFGSGAYGVAAAVDALAVYVNKDNPIACLTEQQVDQIFSKDHWNSGGKNIATWDVVGLPGDWAGKPISMFGRNSLSGTYDTFKESVLLQGEFKDAVKQMAGSEAVVGMVADDKYAIGYSGIGYLIDGVRAVPLEAPSSGKCFAATAEFASSGDYPLARYLYLYVNKNPKQPLDPLVSEFIRFVLSKDGQTITGKGGFFPIPNSVRVNALRRLGIEAAAG